MRQLMKKTLNFKTQKDEPCRYSGFSPVWQGESLMTFFDEKDGYGSRFLQLTGWSLDWRRGLPISVVRELSYSASLSSRIIIWCEGGQLWFSDITGNHCGYLASLIISNPDDLPPALQQALAT